MILAQDPKNRGYEFEARIYDLVIKECKPIHVIYEKDLLKLYGWHLNGIDFVLEFPEGIVLLQLTWIGSRRKENRKVNAFVKAVQNITKEVFPDRRLLFGLYVSRLRPFEDNIELMAQHNIECINDFFSMEKVIQDCYMRLQNGVGA
jgi:hypothetical protein